MSDSSAMYLTEVHDLIEYLPHDKMFLGVSDTLTAVDDPRNQCIRAVLASTVEDVGGAVVPHARPRFTLKSLQEKIETTRFYIKIFDT